MFEKGSTVIYKGTGICKIDDIRRERFGKTSGVYYVLSPLFETVSSRFFVPVGSEDEKFKPVLKKEEIDGVLESAAALSPLWIENDKLRKRAFAEIIRNGDRAEIIRAIAETNEKQLERQKNRSKLRACDEQFLKDAQRLVESELAFVLNIESRGVRELIMQRLGH